MPDPIEGVLDGIDPNNPTGAADAPAVAGDDTKVTLDKDKFDEMNRKIAQLDDLLPVMDQLRNNPNAFAQARTEPAADTRTQREELDAKFYDSPTASAEVVARGVMAPAEKAMAEKFASFAINSFKADKRNDPFYDVAVIYFDREVGQIPKEQIGKGDDASVQRLFNTIWNAGVGEYASRKQAERKANPPPNMGSGASNGAGGQKDVKHLRDIDPVAYQTAVQGGLSEEAMAEIAKEYAE